jgi:phage baseplate assembly protein W
VDRQLTNRENSFLGSGWSFPVTFSVGNFQLTQSSYEDNINESINIILQTKNGERCFEPQFGSGLQQFFFRTMDETLKGEIREAVKTSLLFNEPRITVKDVNVIYTDLLNGFVEINISYMYNQTNTRHNHVFPFHLKEGTNLGL